MKHLLILYFVSGGVVALVGCTHQKNHSAQLAIYAPEIIDTNKYAILKFDKKEHSFLDTNSKPASLSITDIKTIEALVEKSACEYNEQQQKFRQRTLEKFRKKFHNSNITIPKNDIEKPFVYCKQLISVLDEKGEKIVFVNCLSPSCIKPFIDDNLYWKKEIIVVFDGGTCYFHLKINLTQKKVYYFRVNGNA